MLMTVSASLDVCEMVIVSLGLQREEDGHVKDETVRAVDWTLVTLSGRGVSSDPSLAELGVHSPGRPTEPVLCPDDPRVLIDELYCGRPFYHPVPSAPCLGCGEEGPEAVHIPGGASRRRGNVHRRPEDLSALDSLAVDDYVWCGRRAD